MLKNLFNKNPLLKVLLPLLLLSVAGIIFIQLVKPQLAYRQELAEEAQALSRELSSINKAAAGLSSTNKEQLEEQLKTMRDNLGLGLYSPELVQILEERARQTRIQINSFSFAEVAVKDGLEQRQVILNIQGRYQAILAFQVSLEEFPPFTGAETIDIRPLGSEPEPEDVLPDGVNLPPGIGLGDLSGTGAASSRRGVISNGIDLEAELSLSFSAVPEALEKIDSSELPVREHPFR